MVSDQTERVGGCLLDFFGAQASETSGWHAAIAGEAFLGLATRVPS